MLFEVQFAKVAFSTTATAILGNALEWGFIMHPAHMILELLCSFEGVGFIRGPIL
jgi:hypothetical protein